jgi:hypothetical protein
MRAVFSLAVSVIFSGCSGLARIPYKSAKTFEVNATGQARPIKGQLIAADLLAHSTHWPHRIGDRVAFLGRDGKMIYRVIFDKENFGFDLALLTLDEPVEVGNHFIAPVGEARVGEPVTIFRHWGREPLGTIMRKITPGEIFGWTKKKNIISGDSGGAWYQLIEGKPHLVGLSHRAGLGGRSPNLHAILTKRARGE